MKKELKAEILGRAAVDVTGSGSVEFVEIVEAVTLAACNDHKTAGAARKIRRAVEAIKTALSSVQLAALYTHYNRTTPGRIFDALAADSIAVLLRAGV